MSEEIRVNGSKSKKNGGDIINKLKLIIWLIVITILTITFKNYKIVNVDTINNYEEECIFMQNEIEELKEQLNDTEEENDELENKINTLQEEEKKQANTNRGVFPNRKHRKEKLIVTAYAPFDNQSGICSDGDPTKTATGTYPKHGTVAANPNRFPYGTKFYIEGYGYATCEDTGSAMRKNSNKIDIFMETHEEAIKFGKQEIEVIIFED